MKKYTFQELDKKSNEEIDRILKEEKKKVDDAYNLRFKKINQIINYQTILENHYLKLGGQQ